MSFFEPSTPENYVTFRKMLSATIKLEDHPMLEIHIITQLPSIFLLEILYWITTRQ